MRLIGHAALFNSRSVDLGGFFEVISPGAFRRTLADGHNVLALHYHQHPAILGSTRSGALSLREDDRGLAFELALPETSLGRDVHALVKRGDLASMSFAFRVPDDDGEIWRQSRNGIIERTLLDVDLSEISTVALPAYPATSVSARSVEQFKSRLANDLRRRTMAVRLRAA